MEIGFTGTQAVVTDPQLESLMEIIDGLDFERAHHGDCIGADNIFHIVLRTIAAHVIIEGHPPSKKDKRAFCKFDEENQPHEYLIRNRHIVRASDLMIACPKGPERKRGSGTWATIRFARKQGKPMVIIWPDGTCTYEV